MRERQLKESAEILLVISGDSQFLAQVQQEFDRRRRRFCIVTVGSIEGARHFLEVRPPSAILLEESSLGNDLASQQGLWAAATSLAESAPVVVIGSAEHQAELTALLASGAADYVTRSESALNVAVGLVERRLRHRLLRPSLVPPVTQLPNLPLEPIEPRDFGEVLRHELNNPLTGILGNAELLLVELRRKNIELPSAVEVRLETIATLAVRMRETVRRLSEEWESNSEKVNREIVERRI